jgi:hypothetical protein
MVYLLTQNEDGKYIKDGTRYDLLEASWAKGPRAKDFVEFESSEEALKTWGLTEVENADEN